MDVSVGQDSVEARSSKGEAILVSDNLQDPKTDDGSRNLTVGEDVIDKSASYSSSSLRTEASSERSMDKERGYRERNREKSRDCERGKDSDRDRERDESDRSRDMTKDKGHRSKSGLVYWCPSHLPLFTFVSCKP